MRFVKDTRSQQNHSTLRNNLRGRVKPKISADYVIGLVDGEGCFYVNVRKAAHKKWRPRVQAHLYIKLKQEDFPLLKEVNTFFGCGKVYYQKETRSNHTPCFRFEVNSHKDLIRVVVPFFETHPLQSSKDTDFLIFKDIVRLIETKEHLTEEGLEKIRNLKKQMNLGARRVREIRSHGGNAK
ncbi:MAG: LAGLIDADG family homing endonuclease [Patescibacteria group bacterium]